MDDYIAKPLGPVPLGAILDRWVRRAGMAQPVVEAEGTDPASKGLNPKVTGQLRKFLGTRVAPIVDQLLADMPARIASLLDAAGQGDLARARQEAHTVKGACANLGADHVAQLCVQIENACRGQDEAAVRALGQALEVEFRTRAQPALEAFKGEVLGGTRS